MLVLPPIDVGSYLCGSVTAKSRRKQHWESSSGEIQGEIKVKLDFFFLFFFCECNTNQMQNQSFLYILK